MVLIQMERYSDSELENANKSNTEYNFSPITLAKNYKLLWRGNRHSCIGIINTGTSCVGQNLLIT